jgi:hypothetical protein
MMETAADLLAAIRVLRERNRDALVWDKLRAEGR